MKQRKYPKINTRIIPYTVPDWIIEEAIIKFVKELLIGKKG